MQFNDKSRKYLIISPTGVNSLLTEWTKNELCCDLALLYYDSDLSKVDEYKKYAKHIFVGNGEKWNLAKQFISQNLDFVSKYEYIWFPDDDLQISSSDINSLFEIASSFNLDLCQPAASGYTSHPITSKVDDNVLRYTNFVEIMAPMFKKDALLKLYDTFDLNRSGWGYDFLWPCLLRYPKDKIAIVDSIEIVHTNPVGGNYSPARFPTSPLDEMHELFRKYYITPSQVEYGSVKKP